MKKITVIVLILVLVLSLTFAFSSCVNNENTIRLVEVTHSIFYAPLYIAMEKGYFDEAGLEIELANGGGADKCMTMLISKQADIGLMGPEAGIYILAGGREDYPIIFGQLTKKDGSFLVGRTNYDNFDWQNLVNSEIIGGRPGGVPAMTLEYALRKNNLIDKQNITINYGIQYDMIIPAFEGGQGDFCTMFEPAASNFVKSGKGYILASVGEMAGDMPFTAFMATKSYLESNNEKVIKFVTAIQKSINYLFSTPSSEIAELLKNQFIGVDVDILADSIDSYKRIGAYCSDLIMKQQDFDHLQDVILYNGIIKEKVDFNTLVNNDIANSVLKEVI